MGNKIDLREEAEKTNKDPKTAPIARETARKIIEEEMKCKYIECSALTQEGLKEIFTEAVRVVLQNKKGKRTEGKKGDEGSSCSCSVM